MKYKWLSLAFLTVLAVITPPAARAQNVTITPLGAAAGEFCVGDRALLFEDPTGVRILIAPGRTVGLDTGAFVRGSADPALAGQRARLVDRSSARGSHRRRVSHHLRRCADASF